ncbi:MAG: T9SS type A sorting domain-containing protein [Candidatus Latescibacteria bacterium]|nr:T9SS type A sorting domain-containing protein [Candidatus Latescibacterota bacterium]
MKTYSVLISVVLGLYITTQATGQIFENVAKASGIGDLGDPGVAWLDYNNDGWLDLFVTFREGVRPATTPGSRLFHNHQGVFREVTESAQIYFPTGFGAAIGDYDNDGHVDLYIVGLREENILYRNLGDGAFTDVTDVAGVAAPGEVFNRWSGSFVDYNNDGWLDLYVGIAGDPNVLYQNRGDGTFADVAEQAGVIGSVSTHFHAFGDIDNDGFMDLFTGSGADDEDTLYRNRGDGTFTDITVEAGIMYPPMDVGGVAFLDYDGDGRLDLFLVSNSAGAGNRLYRNEGDLIFADVSQQAGIAGGNTRSIGMTSGDYDNDGWLDLYTASPTGANKLFRNNGNGTFTDAAAEGGVAGDDNDISILANAGDYDRDGFLDLFIANQGTGSLSGLDALYRNRGNANHWLQLDLVGIQSNRSAIGARVSVQAGDLFMVREVNGGDGFGGETLLVEFGLGDHAQADLVEIRWPGGGLAQLRNVAADQQIRVLEGQADYHIIQPSVWVEEPPDSLVMGANVRLGALVRPALFEPGARIRRVTGDLSALGGPEQVDLRDLGDGTYQLAPLLLPVVGENGLRNMDILVEQETSIGIFRTNLTKSFIVAPAEDRVIFGDALSADWRIEPNTRIAIEVASDASFAPDDDILSLTGERSWRMDYIPSAPVEPTGYESLRFRFHPGEAVLPERGSRLSLTINGGQAMSILDVVDLTRRDWQVVTLPLDLFEFSGPIAAIRLQGSLIGTFYLDDLRVVAAKPAFRPTAIGAERQQTDPVQFSLRQNYPNPFNSNTTISYRLIRDANVELTVYDILGQKVRKLVEGRQIAGSHFAVWNGFNDDGMPAGSGIFIYRLVAGTQVQTRRMVYLK